MERDRKGVHYCCLVGQCVHRNDLLLQQNSLQYCWPGWFIADHMAITGLTACALCAPLAPLAPPPLFYVGVGKREGVGKTARWERKERKGRQEQQE